MRTLNPQEKRTFRFATIGISLYLVLFGGVKLWKHVEGRRQDYQRLVAQAQNLKLEVKRYETKIAVTKKLMEIFHLDPAKLNKSTVVAEASAAIQRVAQEGGFQMGKLRESPARPSSKELASIQLEGSGPVLATMGLLYRLETCGYPLVIDSVQITADPTRPGQNKLSLTVIILDFDQLKKMEAPHA